MGQAPPISLRPRAREVIVPVLYQPPGGYQLDLEVKEVSVERGRPSVPFLGLPERLDFHLFLYLTSGAIHHFIDGERVRGRAGSLVTARPGQVQQWILDGSWRGWLILFRPEFVRSRPALRDLSTSAVLDAFPAHMVLDDQEQEAIREVVSRMAADACRATAAPERQALLHSQLEELILRLKLACGRVLPEATPPSSLYRRFRRFSAAVENHFAQLHDVAEYARRLGCSPKTLARASQRGSGLSGKAFIAQRIALEAKRLLAHTDLPSSEIALLLGFDEATNFAKFFRRVVGCVPSVFRARHRPRPGLTS